MLTRFWRNMQGRKSNYLSILPKNITSTRQCLASVHHRLHRLHRLDRLGLWEWGAMLDSVVAAQLLAEHLAHLVLPVDFRPHRKEAGSDLWRQPHQQAVGLEGLVVAPAEGPLHLAHQHSGRQGGSFLISTGGPELENIFRDYLCTLCLYYENGE